MTLTPGSAAVLQALAFLGTIALVAVSTLVAVGALVARRTALAGAAIGTAVVGLTTYAVVLVVLGATSRERVLGPGETKVFCELDCHLVYTVPRVRTVPAIGDARARGTFYLVTVRTTFDASTTAPWRGDGPLYPNPRRFQLVDSSGRAWRVDPAAQRALATSGAAGTPIETPLHPGESYETTVAFDVPPTIDGPRLELTEAGTVPRFMIGHERSPFHAKTLFALGRGFAAGR